MTMLKKAFLVDLDRCIGCFACEIACKDENDLVSHIRRIKVNSIEVDEVNKFYVPIFALDQQGKERCTLCPQLQAEGRKPACVHNCLTNALYFGSEEEMRKRAGSMPGEKMSIDYEKVEVIYASQKSLREVTIRS